MKYFSSNFNVPLNAKQMISNVMEIKKTSMCGFYMEKDTYMNEAPYLEILSVSSTSKMILEQDILDIYNTIKRKKIPEPLVICKNNDFKYKGYLQASLSQGKYNSKIEQAELMSPNNTTDGMLQKGWIIENNKRILVKGTYQSSQRSRSCLFHMRRMWSLDQYCTCTLD